MTKPGGGGARKKVFLLMSSAHWVKRHACALDETSRFRAPTRRRHPAFLLAFPIRKCFTLSAGASSFPQKQSFCGSPTKSAAIGIMFFRSVYPRIGSSVTLAHWMKHHVSGRPHDVGIRPFCSHFLCGNASPCRPVPPLSHKSKAFAGAL